MTKIPERTEAVARAVVERVAPQELDDVGSIYADYAEMGDTEGNGPKDPQHGLGGILSDPLVAALVIPVVAEVLKEGAKATMAWVSARLRERAKGRRCSVDLDKVAEVIVEEASKKA